MGTPMPHAFYCPILKTDTLTLAQIDLAQLMNSCLNISITCLKCLLNNSHKFLTLILIIFVPQTITRPYTVVLISDNSQLGTWDLSPVMIDTMPISA